MANIQNKYTSMYGGPLVDQEGNIIGMNFPVPNNILKTHMIAIPSYYLAGIIQQYLQTKAVRKPFLGIGVKWTANSDVPGAIILKVNQESSGGRAGLKLGDIITEVNGIKIKNGKDLSRIIGYNIGGLFRLKVHKNGKNKIVELKTE